MKTIFSEEDFTAIKKRIEVLSDTTEKKWGTMTLQQMIVHCIIQLKLALGELPSKTQGPFFYRTLLGRWLSLSALPWPKGAGTPIEMNLTKHPFSFDSIENEKAELLGYLEKVKTKNTFSPHPFFGLLTHNEWGRLIYKHLDHHLKQFGT